MSLIENEDLDDVLIVEDGELPSFNKGRVSLADAMTAASPMSSMPEYWVGVHHAFAARLRHEGVNRSVGSKKPSIESFYPSNEWIVQDVHGVLAKISEKARAHLSYLKKNREGRHRVRFEQYSSIWSEIGKGKFGPRIEAAGRTAFTCGLTNCHSFLKKENREYHEFYANRRAQPVQTASNPA